MTLLELLTVVAIIALLLALMLPALGSAREQGRTAKCLATLHHAGLAATMYFDDHDGSFWPYASNVPGPGGGRRWWFGFEAGGPAANASQPNRPLDRTQAALARYLTGTSGDLECPSFPYGQGKYFPKFSPAAGGYGYNTGGLAGFDQTDPFDQRIRRIDEFAGRTADVFLLADGIHFDRLDYSAGGTLEQPFNEPPYIQWQDPAYFSSNLGVNGGYGHFRHSRRAMVLYLDSHAAGQPVRRTPHPYTRHGYGPATNLTDESLRVRRIQRGNRIMFVDAIYGLAAR